MQKFLPSLFFFLMLSFGLFSQEPLNIGEIHTLKSAKLGEDRQLNIFLPQDYSAEKQYPVLYLLDGSLHEDFLHLVGLWQFFNLQFETPEFIIVGIANVDRTRDFTFHPNDPEQLKDLPTAGNSDQFIAFLEEECQPFVEENFSTNGERFLIGQSLGGLVATEILLTKPKMFDHYLIVSPSLWWDDESLLKKAPELLENMDALEAWIFIAVGKKEHPIMRREAKKLSSLLKKYHPDGMQQDFLMMKKENHASILHNAIYEGFMRLWDLKS